MHSCSTGAWATPSAISPWGQCTCRWAKSPSSRTSTRATPPTTTQRCWPRSLRTHEFQGPRMIIPIVIGAIALGRSFDMKDASPKPHYIFDSADLTSNLKVIPRTFTQSQYRLIESSSDSSDLLDVDGEFSLKVKQGQFGLQGYGKYLSSTVNRDKTVEMLITVYHETQTETFPSYTKLRTDWQQRPQREVGTHYIRSITYGGQLIISYQLKATKDEYMEEIKAAVSANLALSGKLDVDVTGKLEKLTKKVADKSTVTISAYATAAGTFSPPTSIEACLKLVDEYPEMVKKLNDGKGAPLKIELVELASLQSNYSAYLKNYALDGMLNAATDKYDDIRVAMSEYKSWEGQGQIWPDEEEKMINAYQRKLKEANRAMSTAISNLDATGDLEQFDEAFKVYGEGPENIPNKYTRDLKKLIYTVEKKPFYWFPFTKAVSHYIHWGSVNCSLPSPEPLFIGYAGTSPKGFGNGGNVECLRARNPSLEPKPFGKGTVVSQINGLLYELPDKSTGQVLCSFCKLENATAAYTIAGRTECPNEMKLEYSGFLSTSRDAGTGSAMVCLDKNPESDIPSEYTKADSEAATLVPLWMVCPDCDEDENKKYVSCVLCSR